LNEFGEFTSKTCPLDSEFYKNRVLSLDEIVDHYVTRFYVHGRVGSAVFPIHNYDMVNKILIMRM
jgi:hypothetical protein